MGNLEIMKDSEQKIYVSQKAILFDKDGKILTMRRTKSAPSRPLFWDLPGGGIEAGEDLNESISREIKEETGLKIKNLEIIDAVGGFNDCQEFWITLCYVAQLTSKNVILSYEHDDYKLVTADEFLKLKISPKIKKFIERFQFLHK